MIVLVILIVILFPVGMLLRKKFPNLCALCFATASTWILGLLYVLTSDSELIEIDSLSLGILMGGSVVGSMYYLSSKLSEKYSLFKLPYLLSSFVASYLVLNGQIIPFLLAGIGVLRVIFFVLYIFRNNPYVKNGVEKIISCCKNW